MTRKWSPDDTIPFRPRWAIEETQPVVRLTQPPEPYAPPPSQRRSCLARLLVLLGVLLLVGAGLALLGYGLWQWSADQPRMNVLILGLDRRPGQGNAVRSDTMILVTVYPPGPRVALLSIPRDLYVEVPGHGPGRVNAAHSWGENAQPGSGPSLAMQTVAQNFGLPVHRYVRLDFDGFRAIVDSVGGIDVVVETAIVDNAYPTDDYGTIRIEIPAGPQHMDGETALRYARSRHGSSDFERAERQQQIVVALARRLLEPEVWADLPLVHQVLMNSLETDLTTWELVLLAPTLYRVGPDGIERRVIDREMTQPWTTSTGGSVLLPRWEAIRPLLQELFIP